MSTTCSCSSSNYFQALLAHFKMTIAAMLIGAILVGNGFVWAVFHWEPQAHSTRKPNVTSFPRELHSGFDRYPCVECEDIDIYEDWNIPQVFIPGVQHGSTTSMNDWLQEHPSILKMPGETHFFDQVIMKSNEDAKAKYGFGVKESDRCRILTAYKDHIMERQAEYFGETKMGKETKAFFLDRESGFVIIDKTPKYLLASFEAPQRILCASPNAKVVMLLRNPTSRAYSGYWFDNYHRHHKEAVNTTFADLINTEVDRLTQAGLMNVNLTPAQEYALWKNYNSKGKEGLLARGLYAIQVRQWISVFWDFFGPDKVWDHLLLLESEKLFQDYKGAVNKVLDFLHLPPLPADFDDDKSANIGPGYPPMDNNTRIILEEFYRPHNKKLHQLLYPFGIEISWAKEDYNT